MRTNLPQELFYDNPVRKTLKDPRISHSCGANELQRASIYAPHRRIQKRSTGFDLVLRDRTRRRVGRCLTWTAETAYFGWFAESLPIPMSREGSKLSYVTYRHLSQSQGHAFQLCQVDALQDVRDRDHNRGCDARNNSLSASPFEYCCWTRSLRPGTLPPPPVASGWDLGVDSDRRIAGAN